MKDGYPTLQKLHAYFYGNLADYHIANLKEALKVAPDTGDWHGELRFILAELENPNTITKPNVEAINQVKGIVSR